MLESKRKTDRIREENWIAKACIWRTAIYKKNGWDKE